MSMTKMPLNLLPFTVHPRVTEKRIIAAVKRDDGTGFCVRCGKSQKYVEPDACEYACKHPKCRVIDAKGTVYGAEQLLLMGAA